MNFGKININGLVIFITLSINMCVYGYNSNSDLNKNSSLVERSIHDVESRGKNTGHYFLYPYHGWYALSWIYWIKVKLIIIAFFAGTALIWAIQYISKFYRHCQTFDTHYGHYRYLDDPATAKFLQNLK